MSQMQISGEVLELAKRSASKKSMANLSAVSGKYQSNPRSSNANKKSPKGDFIENNFEKAISGPMLGENLPNSSQRSHRSKNETQRRAPEGIPTNSELYQRTKEAVAG